MANQRRQDQLPSRSLRLLLDLFMNHSLKQVVELELHHRYLLFERSETAGQVAANGLRIQAFQNLGAGEIGEVPRPGPDAGIL
jgi:hypothetical protein